MRKEMQKLQPKYLLQKFNVERKVKLNVIFCFPTMSITACTLIIFLIINVFFSFLLTFFFLASHVCLTLKITMISSDKKASASSLELF